jgi:hypothetical protein
LVCFSGLTLTYTFGENHVTVQTKTMNLLENIDTKKCLNMPSLWMVDAGQNNKASLDMTRKKTVNHTKSLN